VTIRSFHAVIRLHGVNELASLARLHGFGGTVMAPEIVSSVRTAVTNCPGQSFAIGVIERALQMDGSGGRIDDVIDDGERPGGRTIRRILREGLHLQFAISAEAPDGGEVLFRAR